LKRVVKDPEIRRQELIDVAEKLFIKKGFEKTAVSDIVKKAKVAQGTYYYYFKTKTDVLDAIFDKYIDEIKLLMNEIIENKDMNAVQKLIHSYGIFKEFRGSHKEMERLVDFVHDKKNEGIHHRLEKKNTPAFVNFYEQIIEQGVSEGLFDTEYPHEAAQSLLASISAVSHGVARPKELNDEIKRLFLFSLDLMERILGAKKGTFIDIIKLLEE
jgi:AcrR family transcriptional regulator